MRSRLGTIGLSLVVLGTVLGFLWADCLGTSRGGGWECQNQGFSFALLGAPALVVGIPLTLAAFATHAPLWRKATGGATSVVMAIALAIWIGESSSAIEDEVSVPLVWLLGMMASLGLGYLIAGLRAKRGSAG